MIQRARRHLRGLSILEVAIAFVLLGLTLVPLIELFGSAARQTRQTGDVGLAMTLQEKVADELRVTFWENPHALDDPALNMQAMVPVIDGQSPFFRGIEDTAAPFGQIDDTNDAGVDKAFPSLYRELSKFEFGVTSTRRMLPTTGEVVDVMLTIRWKDGRQMDRSLDLPTVLPVMQVRLSVPLQVRDRAAADNLIRTAFYAPGPATLDQAAQGAGANVATIRDLGDLVLIMAGLAASRAAFDAATAASRAEIASLAGIPRFRARVTLSRIHEARTAAYIQAVTYLGPRLARLGATPALGSPPPPPAAYWDSVVMAAWLPTRLSEAIGQTALAYTEAYNDPVAADLPRVRARVFMKLLELAKLQALTAGITDPAYISKIVDGFSLAETGRHRSYDQFTQVEKQLVASVGSIRESYSAPDRLAAWNAMNSSAGNVAQALLPSGSAQLGGGGTTPQNGGSPPPNTPDPAAAPTDGGLPPLQVSPSVAQGLQNPAGAF